jgi:DNA polymerase-4
MDAFYASVEQRDNPALRGRPVAVGGSAQRGVVAAASYEARKFGVRSAMASALAIQKCPELVFVTPDFAKYKQVSQQVMSIFREYTDLVEPLSLDEAYLDVTVNKKRMAVATDVAREIKTLIKEVTGLTASAGVSYCKFLAKVASGYQKPDGLTLISPAKADAFIAKLPIGEFYGVGQVTAARMKSYGIHTGADLRMKSQDTLTRLFGMKSGTYYYEIARGIDEREVRSVHIRKSIGAEETFDVDLDEPEHMRQMLKEIAEDVSRRCVNSGSSGRTITLKIKYHDFVQTTRSRTMPRFLQRGDDIFTHACELLETPFLPEKRVRLLGISLSNLDTDPATQGRTASSALQLSLDLG